MSSLSLSLSLSPSMKIYVSQSEPTPIAAPRRMDGNWMGNTFSSGSSSLANHDGYIYIYIPPTYQPKRPMHFRTC
jgi:hypothetical protein